MSADKNVLNRYLTGDFSSLRQDLDKKINDNGDTILHIIAMKLDKDALEKIGPENIKPYINIKNKRGECPIHKALEAIQETNNKYYEFINYLIDNCGANTEIADNKGRIVAETETVSPKLPSSLHETLSMTASERKDDDADEIEQILGQYGGVIKKKLPLDDSDKNDVFNLGSTISTDWLTERIKTDPEVTKRYNDVLEKIKKVLDVDEETARIYRLILKKRVLEENPDLRKREFDAQKIDKVVSLLGDTDKSAKAVLIKISKEMVEDIRTKFLNNPRPPRSDEKPKKTTDKPKENKPKKEKKEKKTKKAPKEEKPKKKSKASETGYLHSDELIFSPNY